MPPDGRLDGESGRPSRSEEKAPASRDEAAAEKAAAKEARKEAALAAAEAKKTAAAEQAKNIAAEKQAAAEAKRAAAAEKAAAKEARAVELQRAKGDVRKDPDADGVAGAVPEYVLQAGDEIDIQVYREPELSGTFKINPAGAIRHSLAGAVPLAGKTVAEAEAFFTRKLAQDYLVNPRVIVKLLSTQSSQVVVLGEVEKPGVYPLPFGESMTLLQAIAGAGGFTELASPDRVRIVRKLPDGGTTTLRVRVSDLLRGKGRDKDVPLEPNDVIMVDQVFF